MKLSITQLIMGIVIILAACYVTGWMIHKAPSELRKSLPDSGISVDVVPEDEALFKVSRYGSYLLPVIGIFLVIGGTLQAAGGGTNRRGLAIGAIIAGVLVTSLAFIIATWGYPTTFVAAEPGGSNLIKIFGNPGRTLINIRYLTAAMILPGLAVVGVGIAQLIKSGKTAGI